MAPDLAAVKQFSRGQLLLTWLITVMPADGNSKHHSALLAWVEHFQIKVGTEIALTETPQNSLVKQCYQQIFDYPK